MATADQSAALAIGLLIAVIGYALRPRPCRRPIAPDRVERRSAIVPRWVADRLAARLRRRTIAPDAVADWCDELARRTRAGSSLIAAIDESVPTDRAVCAATQRVRHKLRRGGPVAETLAAEAALLSGERRTQHLALAYTVAAMVARLGGPPAPGLDRVATALRTRSTDVHERATHAAQARLSAHVLTAVPLLVLATLVVSDPDVQSASTQYPGAVCVVIGIGLNALGWWWMRRMVDR